MADVNVKNQSSSTQASTGQGTAESRSDLQRSDQRRGVLSRSRAGDPFGSFFLNPSEFFSANPFTLMRRMSEEMDRVFGRSLGEGMAGARGVWSPAVEV